MAVFGVLASLLVLAIPVGIVLLVMHSSRRGDNALEHPGWSLRRFLQYAFLLAALFSAAGGLTLLVGQVLPSGARLAGRTASETALGLSLTLVGVPVWLGLWRLIAARLRDDREERVALSWTLYLSVAATVSLIVALVNLVQFATWAVGTAEFEPGSLASAVVWAGVWGLHTWLLRRDSLTPTSPYADLVVLAGSAVGLVSVVIGAGLVVSLGLGQVYDAVVGEALTTSMAEALARNLVLAVLGALVWWWHWLHQASRASRTTLWHVYALVLGVLGGLLAATTGATVALHAVLQWWFGLPSASTAVHFEVLPGSLAALAVGSWSWWYHRTVEREAGGPARGEAERAYRYLVAAVGLVAATAGATMALVAAVQAVAPAPLATADPGGRNTLVVGITLLVVGSPLWALYWRDLQQRVRASEDASEHSPSRRAFLFLVFGASGLAVVGSLAAMLFVFFRELIEGRLGGTILYDLRVAVGLALAAGAVCWYHWTVYREDRSAQPSEPEPVHVRARAVLLVSPGGHDLAPAVAARTGARVRALHRLDMPRFVTPEPAVVPEAGGPPGPPAGTEGELRTGPAPEAEPRTSTDAVADAVAGAVLDSAHEQLLVIVDGDGTVRAIPYDAAG